MCINENIRSKCAGCWASFLGRRAGKSAKREDEKFGEKAACGWGGMRDFRVPGVCGFTISRVDKRFARECIWSESSDQSGRERGGE
jgi:hypothetical protein